MATRDGGPRLEAQLVRGVERCHLVALRERRVVRPGVDANATDGPAPLDDGGPLAELRRLDGGPRPGRTTADADEVEVEGAAHCPWFVTGPARARSYRNGCANPSPT